MTVVTTIFTAALLALTAHLTLVPAARALRGPRRRLGLSDRAGVVEEVGTALFATVLARLLLPWDVVPPALWAVPVAATAATAVGGALLWRDLPSFAGPRRRRTTAAVTSAVVALAAIIAAVVG